MTDVDQRDPRDPSEVVVQQGINPNPGPTKRRRKDKTHGIGGWAMDIFLLLVFTVLGCAEAGAMTPWGGQGIGQRCAEEALPALPHYVGEPLHHSSQTLGQDGPPDGSGRRPRRPSNDYKRMSNGEIGPSSPRDNRSSAVEGNLLCAISVLGVLAGLLAATGASCLARRRHEKGGSRDNQGYLPTTKRIIEAVRTSEAQPRRYDPR